MCCRNEEGERVGDGGQKSISIRSICKDWKEGIMSSEIYFNGERGGGGGGWGDLKSTLENRHF